MNRQAMISEDGRYRYWLHRKWAGGPPCLFVMLNPSTADALVDDPTIRRCIGFAHREGCGSLNVVNLFALRATNPKTLIGLTTDEAAGPENVSTVNAWYRATVDQGGIIIAAWGAAVALKGMPKPPKFDLPPNAVVYRFPPTKGGHPPHPLYQRADSPLAAGESTP